MQKKTFRSGELSGTKRQLFPLFAADINITSKRIKSSEVFIPHAMACSLMQSEIDWNNKSDSESHMVLVHHDVKSSL
jgi:hypothetical protein